LDLHLMAHRCEDFVAHPCDTGDASGQSPTGSFSFFGSRRIAVGQLLVRQESGRTVSVRLVGRAGHGTRFSQASVANLVSTACSAAAYSSGVMSPGTALVRLTNVAFMRSMISARL